MILFSPLFCIDIILKLKSIVKKKKQNWSVGTGSFFKIISHYFNFYNSTKYFSVSYPDIW